MVIKGTNKKKTRIVTVYQPNIQKDVRSSSSVYQKHKRYWLTKNKDKCPNDLLRRDLKKFLVTCIKQKEKLVILVDCNEDVRKGKLDSILRSIGLRSAIRQRHGEASIPPTQHRGSTPIDDIYLSHDIHIVKTGYLAFGDGPGDHRALYVDVSKKSLMGNSLQEIHRQQARRLVTSDQNTVLKFNTLFQKQLNRNHVLERMDALDKSCGLTINQKQSEEYEKMDKLYVAAFHYANKRCRKLKTGDVAFAPETLQLEARKANLWVLCLRKVRGCRVSSKLIKRIAKSVKIKDPMMVSVEEMEMRRNDAFKAYRELKPNSREIRNAWLEKKAINKYGTNNTELGDILTRMRKMEDLRDAHRKIKFVRKKLSSEGTKKLIVPETNGQGHIEITDKEEIEYLLMNTNKDKFQQANSTPLAM